MMQKSTRILVPWHRYPPFTPGQTGGLSVSVWELTQKLASLGFGIDCVTPRQGGFPEYETIGGVNVHRNNLGDKLVWGVRLDPTDKKFVESFDAVLSIENFGSNSLLHEREEVKILRQIHTIVRDRPLSTFVSLNSNLIEYSKMYFRRRKLIREEENLKGVTSICVSKFIAEKMEELSLESKVNLIHIPNGVDTKIFHPMKRSIKRDLLYFGRFQKVKGLDTLIAALNLMEKHGESPLLGIVGNFSQKERAYVLSLATDGVKKRIEFLGHIHHETVPSVLNSSNLLVVPSRFESFSLPSLEAMACGNPIVASRVGGIPELIDDVGGVLVEPGEANALARGISQSFRDDSLVDKALLLGPKKAARYDWEVVAPMFGKLV